MAVSISCCLNLTPPRSNSNVPPLESLPSKQSHLAWPESQSRQRSWQSWCLLAAAAAIVGLEIVDLDGQGRITDQQAALAWDLQQPTMAVAVEASKPQRWSDKRRCPPWRVNSLETIVPENLPRPFARRRWEAVEFPDASPQSSSSQMIPSKIAASPNKCFSL